MLMLLSNSLGVSTGARRVQSIGSCWAFATVANIEGVNFLKTGQLLSLSEQELVDCDKKDSGCHGGLPSQAYQNMIDTGMGLELEKQYPYQGSNQKCQDQKKYEQVMISSWISIDQDEDKIAAALVQHGPLSIGINAGPMQFYSGGVADPWSIVCNPKKLDHGVAIIGYGVDTKSTKPYWVIRNSWGPSWGEGLLPYRAWQREVWTEHNGHDSCYGRQPLPENACCLSHLSSCLQHWK